jgi:hypothetical protein
MAAQVKCEGCGLLGLAGIDVHPWNIAYKVMRWLCRPCKAKS